MSIRIRITGSRRVPYSQQQQQQEEEEEEEQEEEEESAFVAGSISVAMCLNILNCQEHPNNKQPKAIEPPGAKHAVLMS